MTTALIATIDFFVEFQLTLAGRPLQRQVACTRPYRIFPIAALLLETRLAIGFQLLAPQTCPPPEVVQRRRRRRGLACPNLCRVVRKLRSKRLRCGARPPLTTTS